MGRTRHTMGPCLSVTSHGSCEERFLWGGASHETPVCVFLEVKPQRVLAWRGNLGVSWPGEAVAVIKDMAKECPYLVGGTGNGIMVAMDDVLT